MIAALFAAAVVATNPFPELPESVYKAYPEAPRREIEVAWQGTRAIFNRQYEETLQLLKAAKPSNPHTLLWSLGTMFLYHMKMLENFDFKHLNDFKAAERENDQIMKNDFSPATATSWQWLLAGGSQGMKGSMEARRQNYLSAANKGWTAITYLQHAAVVKPGIPPIYDVEYGLGTYHYFTSWAQQKSLILAFFPDRRDQGLGELEFCADHAPLTFPLCSYTAAYLHAQDGRYAQALARLAPLRTEFPENIPVRSLYGRLLLVTGHEEKGFEELEKIMHENPSFTFTGFFLGRALFKRQREPDHALRLLEAFATEKGVVRNPGLLSEANFYVAQLYAAKGQNDQARVALRKVNAGDLLPDERQRFRQFKKGMGH